MVSRCYRCDGCNGSQYARMIEFMTPDPAAQLPKHKRLLRSARSGAILSALMLPAVQLSPPGGYGVITTTGRKTGKQRRKCVRIIRRGDRAYLVQLVPPQIALVQPGAVSSWLLNIRANPRVFTPPITPRPEYICGGCPRGRRSQSCMSIGSTPDTRW